MNINKAKEEIKNTVKAYLQKDKAGNFLIPVERQRPVILMGPPGLGKTAIMKQIAYEEGLALVSYNMTHHTRQSALGLPLIKKEKYEGQEYDVTCYTMSEIVASIYDAMKKTGLKTGILFLDEINCLSETLAPVILQLLQTKTFGHVTLPEGWIIVAAGNPEDYNKSVKEFDMATLDRVRLINVEADFEAWKLYASREGILEEVIAYLNIKKENFYKAYITVEGMKFVTARGWQDLSDLIKTYELLSLEVNEDQIKEYINDEDIAIDFANFRSLYKKYEKAYPIKEVLEGSVSDDLKEKVKLASFDEQVSIVSLLLSALNRQFEKSYERDQITNRLFKMIKEMQEGKRFREVIEERQNKYFDNFKKGIIKEKEHSYNLEALKLANIWDNELADTSYVNQEEERGALREKFMTFNEEGIIYDKNIVRQLDNTFDFLEDNLGENAALILFINELAMGFYSLSFIKEEAYERFYDYNKRVISTDKSRQDLLSLIEEF